MFDFHGWNERDPGKLILDEKTGAVVYASHGDDEHRHGQNHDHDHDNRHEGARLTKGSSAKTADEPFCIFDHRGLQSATGPVSAAAST